MQEISPPPAAARGRNSSPSFWAAAWPWLLFLGLAAGAGYALWQFQVIPPRAGSGGKEQKAPAPPTSVLVEPVRRGEFRRYLSALGTVTAANNVTIRSRIDGQLLAVHFQEGATVAAGALLAEIDSRPFVLQLRQAEGQALRDREILQNARLDLERYRTLWQQDSLPRQQWETQEALVRQAEATVQVDQGIRDSAQLQLDYCRILAPFGGRVGIRLVDPGNMVRANDPNGLVTIAQIQPIAVLFSIPEDHLPEVLARQKSSRNLQVDVYDRGQKVKLASGVLTTVDNQIDPSTGTVKLKASFANREQELFPNQFVNVKLLLESKADELLVPLAAIQRGAQGPFVYLVGAEKEVKLRPLLTGAEQGEEIAVLSGLEVGEQVVVDGAERLREGSKVEIREGPKKLEGGREGKEKTAPPAKSAP